MPERFLLLLVNNNNNKLSTNVKVDNFILLAAVMPAIFIIGASYAECNRGAVVVMFVRWYF